MADSMSRASLAGAVDLSSLRKPEVNQATGAQSQTGVQEPIRVPDLVALGNANNLKGFVTISANVPVVIEFFSAGNPQSDALAVSLEKAVRSLGGRTLLVRIDAQASPEVVQAFAIQAIPSVVALIKGQPVPLFEGDQPLDHVNAYLNRLLQVAQENGVAGALTVSDEFSGPVEPTLPPKHLEAIEAIEAGNYQGAVAIYQGILLDSPADALAVAGLAQAKLLERTRGVDFDAVLGSAPQNQAEALLKADVLVAIGHAGQGYHTVLTRFAVADKDEREVLRKHLLELFSISQPDAPELAQARRALAALLY
jgi:putative thioredoxin